MKVFAIGFHTETDDAMTPIRIFISSVQSELAQERETLREYVREDALLRRFFDVFLFEDVPASNRRPDELYLDEVERCDLYVGLFGWGYGSEDEAGASPTEREFDRATALGVHRLIFVKGAEDGARHPKMRALIGKAQAGADPKAVQHPGRVEDRTLRRVGGISGSQGIAPLGAVRRRGLRGCGAG